MIKYGIAEKKEKEIDLDNPIFVYYINIDGMSPQNANETIVRLNESWVFPNLTTWIVPRREGETKIECIYDGAYDGRVRERSEELRELIEELNEKIDSITNASDFDEFKIIVRDWRLKALLK